MKNDPFERSLEIEQAQLRSFARSIAEVEWLLLILVMLYLFATRPELAREPMVIGILAGFTAFVLLFRYSTVLAGRTRAKISLEIVAMAAFLTLILWVSGREASSLVNLYLLPIITAALAFGKRATALVLLLVAGCYLLLIAGSAPGGALSTELVTQAVGVLAPFVLVAFLTTMLAENIHSAKERIRALADRDELTRLYNMRAFARLVGRELELASRMEQPSSILMVDLDQLKTLNDTFGHEAGNRALQLVAEALLRLTRSADIVARYGGDEFVVYLAGADKAAAEEVAQRVRNVVFATTLEIEVTIVRLKVSVGVGTFPDDGKTLQSVLTAADRAMYKDKEAREPPKGKLIIQKR